MEWLLAIRLGHYVVGVGSRDLEASLPGEWIALVVSFLLFAVLAAVVLLFAYRKHARVAAPQASCEAPAAGAPGFAGDLLADGSGVMVGSAFAAESVKVPAIVPPAIVPAAPAGDAAASAEGPVGPGSGGARGSAARSVSGRPGRRRAQ